MFARSPFPLFTFGACSTLSDDATRAPIYAPPALISLHECSSTPFVSNTPSNLKLSLFRHGASRGVPHFADDLFLLLPSQP